jgi:hypothetical protein
VLRNEADVLRHVLGPVRMFGRLEVGRGLPADCALAEAQQGPDKLGFRDNRASSFDTLHARLIFSMIAERWTIVDGEERAEGSTGSAPSDPNATNSTPLKFSDPCQQAAGP